MLAYLGRTKPLKIGVVFQNTFYDKASDSALFLIIHQIPGSCSYKILLIIKECRGTNIKGSHFS